jgi:hypothetical protein
MVVHGLADMETVQFLDQLDFATAGPAGLAGLAGFGQPHLCSHRSHCRHQVDSKSERSGVCRRKYLSFQSISLDEDERRKQGVLEGSRGVSPPQQRRPMRGAGFLLQVQEATYHSASAP